MLKHPKSRGNPLRLQNLAEYSQEDGLNSLRYHVLELHMKELYTWILAKIIIPQNTVKK